MRKLYKYFKDKYLYLIGIEKSGGFVEHGEKLIKAKRLIPDSVFCIPSDYIYIHISPRIRSESEALFGNTSYYSVKAYYCDQHNYLYTINIPTEDANINRDPKLDQLPSLKKIVSMMHKIRSYRYDNAIMPIYSINQTKNYFNGCSKCFNR